MSVNRISYSGAPGEVTMAAGVRVNGAPPPPPPPKPKSQSRPLSSYATVPSDAHAADASQDLAMARGRLSVAGARFYKPSSTPVPGHRWNLEQLRASEAIVPLQSGTNNFDSQQGSRAFGTPRNTTTPATATNPHLIPSEAELAEVPDDVQIGKWHVSTLRRGQGIIIGQSGSNQFASQKGSAGFGARRDVNGKHLKRIWELEYPDQAIINQ